MLADVLRFQRPPQDGALEIKVRFSNKQDAHILLLEYVMYLFFQMRYKNQSHAVDTKNSNVFTIYKESLLCENSTYKYDLHNKINICKLPM